MSGKNDTGKVVAISVSKKRGQKKINVPSAELREAYGIVGDIHADGGIRQISLLAVESIRRMQMQGADVSPGDFAENITTEGIDLMSLSLGDRLIFDGDIILEVSKKGKECHKRCRIYDEAGYCIMPEEGIFVMVIKGGILKVESVIEVIKAETYV